MKSKRIACIAMAGLMAASLAGCGGSDSDNKDTTEATKAATEAAGSDSADDTTADAEGIKSYADIQLGTDFTDLSAEIKFYNNRTDMDSDDYGERTGSSILRTSTRSTQISRLMSSQIQTMQKMLLHIFSQETTRQ